MRCDSFRGRRVTLGRAQRMSIQSILAAGEPSVREEALGYLIIIGRSLAGISIALIKGLWRPESISGLPRLDRTRPVWPFIFVCMAGGGAWLGGQMIYAIYL